MDADTSGGPPSPDLTDCPEEELVVLSSFLRLASMDRSKGSEGSELCTGGVAEDRPEKMLMALPFFFSSLKKLLEVWEGRGRSDSEL